MKQLKPSFFTRDTITVSKALLGTYLVSKIGKHKTVCQITETEAYCGTTDPACHVYKSKITERNKVLFSAPGTIYVYSIYGMYCCLNFVAHKKSFAGGVFIRAAKPVSGIPLMKKRRTTDSESALTDGPSKLCISLGINKKQNTLNSCLKSSPIKLFKGPNLSAKQIKSGLRINIDYAGKAKHWPWRFYIKSN
ncbi:MAG: hypothetical protein A2252_06965 [Elusimicrobia bacterium RIFOXYA2_FULL_39_19]|nr:MAG: hypothetical protein A2252_06965 [Elusimicrobia bacterium RIFOXYA2_FULL_39_19]